MTKSLQALSPPSAPQRVIAGIGFLFFTLAAGWVLLSGLSFDATYAFVIRTLMLVTYLLAIPSFLLVIFGLSRSKYIGAGTRMSALLALVVLSPFVLGVLQEVDLRFSTPAPLGLILVVILPLAFIPLALVVAGTLAYGLVDEFRINRGK